jgi:hypothetical protein
MKKFLYRFVLPAIVLSIVYHFGYNSGRTAGIRYSTVLPPVTSTPQATPPASITPQVQPKVIETPEIQHPIVNRVRKTPEGLAVDNRPVRALPSKRSDSLPVKASDKAVFRSPKGSGIQPEQSEPMRQLELSPLKSPSPPIALPLLAKPQQVPQDDCGCDK